MVSRLFFWNSEKNLSRGLIRFRSLTYSISQAGCNVQTVSYDGLDEGIDTMATIAPRPPMPRPPVPQAPRPLASTIAPGNTVPVAAAAVIASPVAPVVPVAPVAAAAAAVEVPEKKKRGRKAGTMVAYYGLFVYDEAGNPQYDALADGSTVARQQKLTTMPALSGEGAFDPSKNLPLKSKDFAKLGDYFRHRAALAQCRVDEALSVAAKADAGKTRTRKTGASVAVIKDQMAALLAQLRVTLSPEQFDKFRSSLENPSIVDG